MKKIILAIILSTIINPVFAIDSEGTDVTSTQYCTVIGITGEEVKIDSEGTDNKIDSEGTDDKVFSNYTIICKPIEKN